MLQTIKKLLLGIVDDIDAGNSNIDDDEAIQIAKVLKSMRKDNPMSKYQAYTYLNMSRAKFDGLIREGKLPKGRKIPGWKELVWYKKDLKIK